MDPKLIEELRGLCELCVKADECGTAGDRVQLMTLLWETVPHNLPALLGELERCRKALENERDIAERMIGFYHHADQPDDEARATERFNRIHAALGGEEGE